MADNRLAFAAAPTLSSSQIPTLLDNANIDGVLVPARWWLIETADDVYDWTDLDTALDAAKTRGKSCNIYLNARSGANSTVAQWLKDLGAQTYEAVNFLGETHEYMLPWDTVFITKIIEFLAVLSTHLTDGGYNATVPRLDIGVPTLETNIPGCKNGVIAGTYTYDRALYLQAWKDVIDAFEAQFPTVIKHICAPTGNICPGGADSTFYREMVSYADTTFYPFATDLTTTGSVRMTPYTNLIPGRGLAYQPIFPVTGDSANRVGGTYPTNLLEMVCRGISDGAGYIEIYSADVLNTDPAIQNAIAAIRNSALCPVLPLRAGGFGRVQARGARQARVEQPARAASAVYAQVVAPSVEISGYGSAQAPQAAVAAESVFMVEASRVRVSGVGRGYCEEDDVRMLMEVA